MKRTTLFGLSFALMIACAPKETETTSAVERSISSSYKQPAFENDKRTQTIKDLAPQIHELFKEHIVNRNIPGVAYGIVVDGDLVIESSLGFMQLEDSMKATTESCFRIASMSKSFTAMAILKLRDDGKLSLNDPVVKHIPEFSHVEYLTEDSPTIDIENLLTMTAGFPEDNPWGDRQLDESDQMLMDLMSNTPSMSNPPSYQFEYSNTGFALLGNIITRVSGMPYQQYIRENILLPLGMNETYYEFEDIPEDKLVHGYRWEDEQWKPEPMLHDGAFGAMGGMITTIKDFGRYVSFHLSAWPPRSDPDDGPVKRSSLREMHNPQFARLYANATDVNGDTCAIMSGYGYGLGIANDCHGLRWVSHGGALPGFGSNYVFFPEYGIGLMAFGNLTYTTPWPLSQIRKLIFDQDSLEPRQLPPSEILLTRQQQVADLIQNWNEDLEEEILAENFYLDRSREHRLESINDLLAKAGSVQDIGTIQAFNQLRGRFDMNAENGVLRVFFTLSPEHDPKVQYLSVSYIEN